MIRITNTKLSLLCMIISMTNYYYFSWNPGTIYFLVLGLFWGYWSVDKVNINYHIKK